MMTEICEKWQIVQVSADLIEQSEHLTPLELKTQTQKWRKLNLKQSSIEVLLNCSFNESFNFPSYLMYFPVLYRQLQNFMRRTNL